MIAKDHWFLAPEVTFLNHGSFGSCPRDVLAYQSELRLKLERNPIQFMLNERPQLMSEAREVLGGFLGVQADDLAFVSNATSGVNTVLRSLSWVPGDVILTTDHTYNACKNALLFLKERFGVEIVTAHIPFPLSSAEEAIKAIISEVTDRTKLALIDHVTSSTALVLPLQRIIAALSARGVEVLVDGAHAPGMLPLDISRVGASYYTGNAHKWLCAPKGAAFLWVHPERQHLVRPLTISHGASESYAEQSRFRAEFDWTGTQDFSPFLCIPAVLKWMDEQVDGGWPTIIKHNRDLALEARSILCDALGISLPTPDEMIGSIATIPLPDNVPKMPLSGLSVSPLQQRLMDDFVIEVPIFYWPAPPKRFIRISAQLYNQPSDYEALANALGTLLQEGI